MEEILLNDIFHLTDEEIRSCKISLNISSGKNAPLCLDRWLKDGSTSDGFWAYYGNQCNFRVGYFNLAFYKLGWSGNQYLFVGAGRITKIPPKADLLPAEYEEIPELQKYAGRLIVDVYKGNTQGRYNFNLATYLNKCKVVSVLPEKYGLEDFPGYKNLSVDYAKLHRAIYLSESWKTALKLQKGIYVIVDNAPESDYSGFGRLYIGSATSSKGMLFDRWKNYADTLTGGNKELKNVLKLKGDSYIKEHFRWTLIEHFDEDVDDKVILEREKYWKKAFNSVNQGLNDNY